LSSIAKSFCNYKGCIIEAVKKHLAIFSVPVATQILEGKKTVETRFSKHKISPFGEVKVGDLVYIKPTGSDVVGQFLVEKVISFEGLDSNDLEMIRKNYGKKLSLGTKAQDEEFFAQHSEAKFGTLIFISRVEKFLTSPIKINKKDRRGWIVLE
jgi:predicted transcriptional regulator